MQYKTSSLALLASTVAAQTCHDYVIISTRGTFELQGPSIGFVQMINNTLNAIPNGVEYDTVYPAAAAQTYELGSDDIDNYINTGLQDCPNQKYALLGYSQGASATMGALMNYTDTSSAFYKSIAAILVIGNPYHVPNATQNVDENDGDATRKYPGSAYNAENDNSRGIPQVYYDSGYLIDICHTEDYVCAPAYPNATFIPGHLHYGDADTQAIGTKWLISKIGAALKSGTSVASKTGYSKPTGTGVHPSGFYVTASRVHPTGTSAPTGVRPTGTGAPTGVRPTGTGAPTGVRPTGGPIASSPPYSGASSLQPAAIYGSLFVVAIGVVSQLL